MNIVAVKSSSVTLQSKRQRKMFHLFHHLSSLLFKCSGTCSGLQHWTHWLHSVVFLRKTLSLFLKLSEFQSSTVAAAKISFKVKKH